MKKFIWFAIFNFIGIFCIMNAFPNISTKQLLALIIGIQCMASGLDFLDHFNKEGFK